MNENDLHAAFEALLEKIPPEVRDAVDFREAIYIIESPSPEDLLHDRHEGDALSRVMRLANIDVYYMLAASEETFLEAFKMIASTIKEREDYRQAMPWIHISAHGGEDGLELTDGSVVQWDILSRLLRELHEGVGKAELPPPLPQGLPKASLCLSSCGAYTHYRPAIPEPAPIQCLVGATRDIGWCQALVAFLSFYYLTGVLRRDINVAVMSMNLACGAIYEEGWVAFEAENLHE